jgi:hypothetical protein
LHERFADWLSTHALVEGDEVVGYHLEQAYRYRFELDPADDALPGLAARASGHLADAGRGALDRSDFNAGRSLLGRATHLLPKGDEVRLALAPDYAAALFESEADQAWSVLAEATEARDPQTRARATVAMATRALVGGYDRPFEQREAWRDEARVVFEEIGDEYGLALYWWSTSMEAWFSLHAQSTADACERVLGHLARSGASGGHLGHVVRGRLLSAYLNAPIAVDEALERARDVYVVEHGLMAQMWQRVVTGRLLAMKGEFAAARELVRGARELYADAGLHQAAGGLAMGEAEVEWRAGDLPASERVLRDGLAGLEAIDERAFFPTAALYYANVLYEQDRLDDVRLWCEKARETTGKDDVVNFLFLDMFDGCLLARSGAFAEAEAAAGRVLQVAEDTDFNDLRVLAHRYVAEMFRRVSKPALAQEHASRSVAIANVRGDIALAGRVREQLARLGIEFD